MRKSPGAIVLACVAMAAGSAIASPATHTDIPVVNCANPSNIHFTDGTHGKGIPYRAPASLAPKLAYYKSELLGIQGPRGWDCDFDGNSSGFALYVQPRAPTTLSGKDDAERPGIQFLYAMGDSNFSQHDLIARVAARFFPSHRAYVKGIIAEEHENAGGDTSYDIPFGPTPAMRITYRSSTRVEYVIAPGRPSEDDDWLFAGGTMSKSSFPVYGAAYLAPDESFVEVVAVRLPGDLKPLVPSIIASAGFAP